MIENSNDPAPPSVAGGGDVSQTAREASARAQERASELREMAREKLGQARDATAETAANLKGDAAEEIKRTARGLDAAAGELEGSPFQQELLREAADGLRQISRAVGGKSLGQIVDDLSDFGRSNPVAYLGGAALAGFALARFARASTPDERHAYDPGDYPERDRDVPAYPTNAPYRPATTPEVAAAPGMGGTDDA